MQTDFLPKTIFLTGGSGYIGRNILREFVNRGHIVRALTRSKQAAKVVSQLGATPVMGSLLDEKFLINAMQGCDWMLHAAGDTNHSGASKSQEETNLKGTQAVFGAARKAGVKRAIYMSSEAVLLTGHALVNANETMPIPSQFPGAYSRTKAMAEMIALSQDCAGFDVIALRPRFVWGRDDTSALPQLIGAAKSGKLAWIDGGTYLTSTTHIANLVHGVFRALEKGRPGHAYFITDGDPVQFRDFITQLLATQNIAVPSKTVPRWLVKPVVRLGEVLGKITGGRLAGPMSWQEYATLGVEVTLNPGKAQVELNYWPPVTVEQGLEELRCTKY